MLRLTWAGVRDGVLVVSGLAIIAYELLHPGEPRMPFVSVAILLIGGASGLAADRRFVRTSPPPPDSPPPPPVKP